MANISSIKLPNGFTYDIKDNSKSTATNWLNGSSIGSLRSVGSTAEDSNYTIGDYAVTEGLNTTASGNCSHAEGYNTQANGDSAHAEGGFYVDQVGDTVYYTTASGKSSHAEGGGAVASGDYSHAEGYQTTASGIESHAEGYRTTASGIESHAEGYLTTASGRHSHAEGSGAQAIGHYSHAEGAGTTASGFYSHVEGSSTTASGECSHAEGRDTTASGDWSHAEGRDTVASGDRSHAGGYNTIAACYGQTAIGMMNEQDPNFTHSYARGKYVFIIGNGNWGGDEDDVEERSNALTVDWDGNVETSGYVTIDSTKGIQYKGTKATYDMIRFLDNTADAYGNGVIVGNGGVAMLTAGESYNTLATASQPYTAGSETAVIASDSEIDLWTNLNSGLSSGKRVKINNQGQVIQPYITLTKTYASNTAVNETAFNRINAVKVGNIIVVHGNLTLTGSLPSGTTVKIGTINGMGTVILTASQSVPVHNSTTMINISVAANGDITLYNYGSSAITSNPWVRFDCCLVASN